MSDQMGGYNPQGGYPQQGGGYGAPQGGGYPQQPGWGQQPAGQQPAYGGAPQYGAPYGAPGAGSKVGFDLQSIMPGGAIAAGAGLLLFIASFFPWYGPSSEAKAVCAQYSVSGCGISLNAWDRGIAAFATILALVIAIVFIVKALKVLPATLPLEMIAAGVLVLADIFYLISFVSKGGAGDSISRGWGLYLSLVLVLALNAGVIMALMASGGVNTLKGGLAKMQSNQSNTGAYGAQQPGAWGQQPQQGWGQPQQPTTGQQSWGAPAQPQQQSWGGQPSSEQPAQPQQQSWGQSSTETPSWNQPQQQPPATGEQPGQSGWPQQNPPQQGGTWGQQ